MFIIREATGGQQLENSSFTDVTWDTDVRIDNSSSIDHPSSASITFKEAGHWLFIYNIAGEDDSGANRRSYMTRLYDKTNSTMASYGFGGGYIRDSGGHLTFQAFTPTILNIPATPTIYTIQEEATTTQGTDVRANLSGVQALKLDDDWDYFRAYKTSSNGVSSTTFVDVIWDVQDEADDAFTHSAGTGTIMLNDAGKYLLCGNFKGTGPNSRQHLVWRMLVNGSEPDAARVCTYHRNTSTATVANGFLKIIDVSASDEITFQISNPTEPTPSTAYANTWTSLTIAKIPDDGDYIMLTRDSDKTYADGVDFDWNNDVEVDSDFTHPTDSASVIINEDGDYLFCGSFYNMRVQGDSGDSTRICPRSEWQVNGLDRTWGGGDCYNRGDQSSQDCFHSGHSTGFMASLSTDDYVTVRFTDEAAVQVCPWKADRCGLQAARIDDWFISGEENYEEDLDDSITLTESLSNAITKLLSDGITITDSLETNAIQALEEELTETVNIVESLKINMDAPLDSDQMAILEELLFWFEKPINDSISITEFVEAMAGFNVAVKDELPDWTSSEVVKTIELNITYGGAVSEIVGDRQQPTTYDVNITEN